MYRKVRVRVGAVIAAGTATLAFTAVASAGGFTAPQLRSPHKGQHVNAGQITLKVYDPGVPRDVRPVYAAIGPAKKLDKYGFLKECTNTSKRCDFVGMKQWKGHPGWWIYKAPAYSFSGWWAITPGKYYWQANHTAPLCEAKGCEVVSKIGTFYVN